MPGLLYSIASLQPRGIAVRLASDASPLKGSWWSWAAGTWTAPFKPADHVLACKPDDDDGTLLLADVPAAALLPGTVLCEYATATARPVLDGTINTPELYVRAASPGRLTTQW